MVFIPDHGRNLGTDGKRRAREDFTWKKACERYVKVYLNEVDKAMSFLR